MMVTVEFEKTLYIIATKGSTIRKLLEVICEVQQDKYRYGFTTQSLLQSENLSLSDKDMLNEIFCEDYEEIRMFPLIICRDNNGLWFIDHVESIPPSYIIKIIDSINSRGSASMGDHLSLKNTKMVQSLIQIWDEAFCSEVGVSVEEGGYDITEEMIEFVSSELEIKLDSSLPCVHSLVIALDESIKNYDEMMLGRVFANGYEKWWSCP